MEFTKQALGLPLRVGQGAHQCQRLAPGYIAPENMRQIRGDAKRNQSILGRIPEGRWGVPEDIASAIVFLASKEAGYMNDRVMNVDGGWL